MASNSTPWRRRTAVWAVGVAVGLANVAVDLADVRQAHAFCRTTTSEAKRYCEGEGIPLVWKTSCMSFSVQSKASRIIGLDDARQHVQAAFDRWSAVDCGDLPDTCGAKQAGAPRISAVDWGPVWCGCRESDARKQNANVIAFLDDAWEECDGKPLDHGEVTLALTTTHFVSSTGEIVDADMLINTATHQISVGDDATYFDLDSILTHEVGHMLGLAHTDVTSAKLGGLPTMYASYSAGQTFMRSLEDDDRCAICTVYPPNGKASCSPEPLNGFSKHCNADQHDGGCQYHPGRPLHSPRTWTVCALTAVIGALAARRRRAR